MKKIDLRKRMREVRFVTENELTPEQRKQLIQDKLERAQIEFDKRKQLNRTYA
jgi:Spy/CpxP family protein refolding chaperone